MAERAHPEDPGFSEGSPYREQLFRRYNFANQFLEDEIIIDIPCGVGWGTSLLKAEKVVGIDISPEAIQYAKTHYPNCYFSVGDMAKIPLPSGKTDSIICLEGLEHVTKKVGLSFLEEANRVLKENGTLILTVPVILPGGKHSGNPYHCYEYPLRELNETLRRVFKLGLFELRKGPDCPMVWVVATKTSPVPSKIEADFETLKKICTNFSTCLQQKDPLNSSKKPPIKILGSNKINILLTTSAAPSQSPFSTTEKRPPIGIGFLISVLRNAGHNVFFIDNYLQPSNFLETDYLQKNAVDHVGIYANTICYRDTLRMLYKLEYLRRTGKWKGKIIVGGPHTTVVLDTIPDFVDHVVQGEGEQAILDIVEGRTSDRVVRAPRIKDLDKLPMPAWDYFVNLPYDWAMEFLPDKPVFTMNTSRGCPFRCSFCSVDSIWGKKYTYFSAERIVSDIEYLIEHYGAEGIYFREDNFTLNKERLMKFCNLLIEKGIKIPWACESRVSNFNKELVELMARAGACGFYFGVESGSQRILDFLKKDITTEQIRSAFKLCQEYGLKTAASVIVGIPTETETDINKTITLLNEIQPTITWFNVFVGIPNSELYQYSVNNKLYEFIDDRGLVYLKGHDEHVRRFYDGRWEAGIPFNKSGKPKISVVMSVYNGASYLKEAVKSILNQTYQDFELIIVDDASTDNTPEILQSFDDPRIKVITNLENLGLTKSLNKGIRIAKGEYIARMDADDISLPHRFEKQVQFLDINPDYALVGSSYYHIDDSGKICSLIQVLTDDLRIREGLKKQNWFGHGSVMMRRDAFLKVRGGYDEKYKFAQDYDLWLRIAEKNQVANIEEPLYGWRLTRSCISKDKEVEQRYYANLAISEAKKRARGKAFEKRSDPTVSVIVPTYNRPEMLSETLNSILNQTYQNFEIIVVNDAGADIENIVRGLNRKNNITYIKHSENRGLATARNTGIKAARGKYIAYLDDDDIYYPKHLETLVNFLETSDYKVAYTDAYRTHQEKENRRYVVKKRDVPYSFDFDYDRILVGNFVPVLCFMHEKSCLDEVGYFDEALTSHEDWDLWIRMSRKFKFGHIKKVTAEFAWRTDGTTTTSGNRADFLRTLEIIYEKYKEYTKNKPYIIEAQKKSLQNLKREIYGSTSKIKCSIIIPVFNQVEYTKQCLEALFQDTPNELYEVIIVDNGSTDGTKKFLKSLEDNVKVITNSENLGFAKACNKGAQLAQGLYFLFLNNDTIPHPGWLDALVQMAETDPRIGVLGSKLLYPDGTIQHAGIELTEQGLPYHVFRGAPHDHPAVLEARDYPAVTGACLLIRQNLFHQLGGFDEAYQIYVEDVDLCLRTWEAGFRVTYCPTSVLTHYESASVKDVARRDAQVREGWRLLLQRWANRWPVDVQRLCPPLSSAQFRLAPGSVDGSTKVETPMVLWQAPIFDPSGYADDARHLILHISQHWPIQIKPIARTSETFLAQMDTGEREAFTRLMNTPLSDRYIHIFHAPAYAFQRDPNAVSVIGRTVFETDSLPPDWVAKCNVMDEVWVPTMFNVETFQKSGVTVPIYAVPEGVDTDSFRPGLSPLPIPGRRGFAFLSVFEWIHRKGWDILLKAWAKAFAPDDDVCLVLRAYPPNITDEPDVQAQLESRINNFLENELGLSRDDVAPIIVIGTQVPQPDMPRLYAAADAYVMPSRGEGWGRPYIEAMACGLPVIGTRWGGNLAFMNNSNSYLVDIEGLVKVDDRMEFPFYRGHRWAQPSAEHLRDLMRYVFANRKASSEKGRQARQDVVEKWGWDNAARLALQRLEALDRRPLTITHQPIAIRWEGSQFVHHSLALVNRELCLRLLERDDVELSLIPYELDQFSPEVDSRFPKLAARVQAPLSRSTDVHIRHRWPPNFTPPPEGHWVMMQPWEYGAIPVEWVKPINLMVDELWVPSRFVKDCYIQSGINPERMFVIPNGVNFDLFNPQAAPLKLKTEKGFKFLFVGGTIWRKGIDILLQAYRHNFTAKDDVCLVIKDMGQDSFYRGQGAGKLIKEIQKDKDAPKILYLKATIPEDQMPGLYTACDCLVHPYRGEGFGLPVAEALSCGLPAILTKGGACDEFCPSDDIYWVPCQRREIKIKLKTAGEPWVLEPSPEVLGQRLKEVYAHREAAKKKGLRLAQKIRKTLSWEKSADLILSRITSLRDKPILRKEGRQKMSAIKGRRAVEYMKMGNQHREDGENKLAERFYQKSLENDPNNQEALQRLGTLLYEEGRFEEAIPLYQKLTKIEPWSAEYFQTLGECFFKSEKITEAKSVLLKGLDLDPTNAQIQSDLGVIFWQEGNLEEALNHLQEALKIAPENPETILNLALICYQVGLYEEAAGLLEKYAHLEAPGADVHLCLGDCYFNLERKDLAKREFEFALSLDPDMEEAQKRLKELRV